MNNTDTAIYLTDIGNSDRLIARHGEQLLYCADSGKWLAWDGTRWAVDIEGNAIALAKESARTWWDDVARCDPKDRRELYSHASYSEKSRAIKAALELSQPNLSVRAVNLDAKPMLFNVANATIDLETGRGRPHGKADRLSKLAPVMYDPRAACPTFDRFLHRIMDGNQGLIDYLARIAGLCLTGRADVQELYIFHGGGANGKSVLIDTLAGMLGDYAGPAAPGLLTQRIGSEHPTEIADLQGKRLVVASETEEGARLKIQLVKQLTGDETLKARFMRQDFFAFTRSHKTLLVTNSPPIVRETTNAIWRRLRLIPFTVTIPAADQDQHLIRKLRTEWPGILNWAMRGCAEMLTGGMDAPAEVIIATGNYQADQDQLGEYLADRTMRGHGLNVSRNDVYADYVSYATQQGDKHPMGRTEFLERIRRIPGVTEAQKRLGGVMARVFVGIGLSQICTEAG